MVEQTQNAAAMANLQRFYTAESAYLLAADPTLPRLRPHSILRCVIYQPTSLPYGGEWRGHAGFEAWMRAFGEVWTSLEVKGAEVFPLGEGSSQSLACVREGAPQQTQG